MVSEKKNYYRNAPSTKEDDRRIPAAMWRSSTLIALQSFLLGYSLVCFNPCLVTGDNKKGSDCYNGLDPSCPPGTVYNDINLTTIEASLGNALTVFGSWMGCLLENYPCEVYGRRPTVLLTCLLFITGAAIACSAANVYTLLIGRFFCGLGVGLSSGVPIVLLAEIATNTTRGTITSMHQIMITWGIFVAGVLSYGFVMYVDHGWQYIQSFIAIPALITLALHHHIPESPKWLLSKHVAEVKESSAMPAIAAGGAAGLKDDASEDPTSPNTSTKEEPMTAYYQEAHDMLIRLRNPEHDIPEELAQIMDSIREDAQSTAVTWSEVLSDSNREGFIIGAGLLFFQAITGINSIISFSTTIFSLAGFKESVIGTLLIGAVRLVIAYLEFEVIDMLGRKTLLLIGTYAMFFSLLMIGIVLLVPASDAVQGGVAATAVLIYVSGFAFGLGSVVWTIISEVLPTRVRMKAITSFLSLSWFVTLIVCFLTLIAINGLGGVHNGMSDSEQIDAQKKGVATLYLIFAGWLAVSLVFMHFYLPETKGRNPEDHTSMTHQASKKPLQLLPSNDPDGASDSKILELELTADDKVCTAV